MINEDNFLKIEYSLLIVQFLSVLVIILISNIPTVFYYLPLGISFILFYIYKKNKKFKIEKIKNFKIHKNLITISTIFLFFVAYLLYSWKLIL
jgi:polyferredoxin